tara:strand:+ start:439 stop:618 length:180 start_codon:yes stop_codon:yes gene_type:complete
MKDLTLLGTKEIIRLQFSLDFENDYIEWMRMDAELDFRVEPDNKYYLVREEMKRFKNNL